MQSYSLRVVSLGKFISRDLWHIKQENYRFVSMTWILSIIHKYSVLFYHPNHMYNLKWLFFGILSSLDARTSRGRHVASIGRGIAHQFSCLITKVRGKVTHFSQQTIECHWCATSWLRVKTMRYLHQILHFVKSAEMTVRWIVVCLLMMVVRH